MPLLDKGIAQTGDATIGTAVRDMPSARHSAALPVALGVLLPLAAVAVGSRLLLRQRARSQQPAAAQQDSESLLPVQLQTGQGSSGSSNTNERVGTQLPVARRQRLAALLSKRAAGTIEMLPFHDMRRCATLAHQVSSSPSWSASGEADTCDEHGNEPDLEAGEQGDLPASGKGRTGRRRSTWGLPTDSLRLKTSQLEVSSWR